VLATRVWSGRRIGGRRCNECRSGATWLPHIESSSRMPVPILCDMSTGQFVVLWLATLALGIVLLGTGSSYSVGLAVLLLAGTSIYSLRPHPKADLRRAGILAALWVVIPIAAIGIVVGGKALVERERAPDLTGEDIRLPLGDLKVISAKVDGRGKRSGVYRLYLRVRNESSIEVSRATFEVTIRDTTGTLASSNCELEPPSPPQADEPTSMTVRDYFSETFAIPPGQVRDGVLRLQGAVPVSEWRATYRVVQLWGRPEPRVSPGGR
jgi:hypothetical protein